MTIPRKPRDAEADCPERNIFGIINGLVRQDLLCVTEQLSVQHERFSHAIGRHGRMYQVPDDEYIYRGSYRM